MTKKTFKILTGASEIDKAITSIATRGKKLENDIHKAAVSCLNHADLHGDITLAIKLVQAVPTMARKNALQDWFLNFGKFGYDTANKVLTFDKKKVTMLEDAIAVPFWEFKPEPEYKPFDMQASIMAVINKAQKAIEKGEEVDEKALKTLRELTTA